MLAQRQSASFVLFFEGAKLAGELSAEPASKNLPIPADQKQQVLWGLGDLLQAASSRSLDKQNPRQPSLIEAGWTNIWSLFRENRFEKAFISFKLPPSEKNREKLVRHYNFRAVKLRNPAIKQAPAWDFSVYWAKHGSTKTLVSSQAWPASPPEIRSIQLQDSQCGIQKSGFAYDLAPQWTINLSSFSLQKIYRVIWATAMLKSRTGKIFSILLLPDSFGYISKNHQAKVSIFKVFV